MLRGVSSTRASVGSTNGTYQRQRQTAGVMSVVSWQFLSVP